MSSGNPKQDPEHQDGVKYLADDGTSRFMRDVIKERNDGRKGYTRKQLDQARRLRCRAIATLETCLCAYPMVRCNTASEHAAWCPAEGMFASHERLDQGRTT